MNYQSIAFTVPLHVDGVSDSIVVDLTNYIKLIGVLPSTPSVVISVTAIDGGQAYIGTLSGSKVTVATANGSPIPGPPGVPSPGFVITAGF